MTHVSIKINIIDKGNGKFIQIGSKTLALSPYVKVWRKGNNFFLFHWLQLKAIKFSIRNLNLKYKSERDVYSKIRAHLSRFGFLRSKYIDHREEFIRETRDLVKRYESVNPSTLVLVLTNSCNLRCKYCFVNKNVERMQWDIAKKAINFFFEKVVKKSVRPSVRFFGGEPLLNFSVLKKSIDYIKSKWDKNCNFSLVTNGTLITDKIADFLKKNNVNVAVSLDGPKEINDKMRIYSNGKGSFDDAKRGIKILEKFGVPYVILVTIQKHNAKNLMDVFLKLSTEFKTNRFGINLPILKGATPLEDIDSIVKQIVNSFVILLKKGIVIESIYLDWVKPIVNKELGEIYCGGLRDFIVADTKGRLGPCFVFTESDFWVNIDDLSSFEDLIKKFKPWLKRTVFNIPECRKCYAIKICGGGCPYNSLMQNGTIYSIDHNFCLFAKKLIKELITYEKLINSY